MKALLKRARNWFLGLGALGLFCLGYYNMCLDVWSEQDDEKIAAKAEELKILRRDQAFAKAQVDRIVNAISNHPPVVVILLKETRKHHHHE